MADDIYQNLLRMLRYESKDTTYKFALLRGLIGISSESLHLISVGASAGQTVMHCQIHLIPRRAGDSVNPRGGVRGVNAGKADDKRNA